MTTRTRSLTSVLTALTIAVAAPLATGCDHAETPTEVVAESDADSSFRTAQQNGLLMNGLLMNGLLMNGLLMNGLLMNGLLMNGALLSGQSVEDTTVVARVAGNGDAIESMSADRVTGELTVITTEGDTLVGGDALPVSITYETEEGARYRINIEEQVNLGPGAYTGGTMFHYNLTYQIESEGEWGPSLSDVCVDPDGDAAPALMLVGTYDMETGDLISEGDDEITIACRHAALAKCAEWSYRKVGDNKWAHQACTRMVRADYEGEGVPYTENGTRIYVGDDLGMIEQTSHPGWLVKEAEWDENGATCINRDALRQAHLTECDWNDDCFPGIPDCANPDSMAPSSPDVIVSGVALNDFSDPDYIHGVQYDPEVGASRLWYAESDGSDYHDLGTTRIKVGGGQMEPVEIDGLFQTELEGVMGFQIDRVGGRSRLVSVWGDGEVTPAGDWIEGHVFRGAGLSSANDGRVVYAIDAAKDDLCRVWVSDGALTSGGCTPLVADGQPVDVGPRVDITSKHGADSLWLVDGDTVWSVGPQGMGLSFAHDVAGGYSLAGAAVDGDGALIGLHGSAMLEVEVGESTTLAQLPSGPHGDLAGVAM